jgi:uncharacterized membrane protein
MTTPTGTSAPSMPSGEVTSDDKLWALLCYILPVIGPALVYALNKKDRPFIKAHTVQALILGVIVWLAGFTICGWILVWVYAIYCGYQAYNGKMVTIPVITDFVKNQGWA